MYINYERIMVWEIHAIQSFIATLTYNYSNTFSNGINNTKNLRAVIKYIAEH